MRCSWLFLALLACKGDDAPPVESPAPGLCDAPPTWESFGKGFTTSWCTPCHAAALPEDERQGAPLGVDLDTLSDLLQWGARVHARAVELGDMPPGGGPSDEELERLDAFITCGMPGELSAASPCSSTTIHEGSITLQAPADVDELCRDGEVVVDGSLSIEGDAGDLSCICEVTGALTVGAEVTEAVLPAMATAGAVVARDSRVSGRLSLPALLVVVGDLEVAGFGPVELPALEVVGGQVVLERQAELELGRLTTVGALLSAVMMPTAQLALPRLTSAGRIDISASDELQALRFDSLSDVGGLALSGLPQLDLSGGFDSLATLQGDLVVQGVGTTELVGLGKLVEVQGLVLLHDLPELQAVGGLRALTTIDGDLTVSEVPQVDPAALAAWADAIEVGGSVTLPAEEPTR